MSRALHPDGLEKGGPETGTVNRADETFLRLPVGLYRRWADGRFIAVNRALLRTLGHADEADLLATSADSLYANAADWQRVQAELAEHGELRGSEARMRHQDGSLLWVREDVQTVRTADGQIFYEGSVTDITDRKEIEQLWLEGEERFRLFSSSTLEGIAFHDQGRIFDANEALAGMFGYPRTELIGKDGLALYTAESRELVASHTASGFESPFEAEGLRADGSTFALEIAGRTLPFGARDVTVLALRDISAHRRALDALQESEEKYSNLFHHSSDAILILGLDGDLVDANRRALDLSGLQRTQLLAHKVHDLLSQGDLPDVRRAEALLAPGRGAEFETHLCRQDGETIPVTVTASLFEVAGRSLVQWSMRDIRDRSRLERQLHQAQRMEAVGRLAGGLAHDFNNLLTVIAMYCDLLSARLEDGSPLRADVEQIQRAGDRAATLTRQLLAFSRQQVLRPRVLDLNHVTRDLSSMLRRLIPENIELKLSLDPELGRVKADPGQLEQVLMNLVVNARDAMPDGGTLYISTQNLEVDDAHHLNADVPIHPGPYVSLKVRDTGQGIEPAVISRIFEPFFSTKDRGQGTGLGLSMVYGIVKQSGGFIFADSQRRRGTEFNIYLPRIDEPLATAESANDRAQPLSGSETVLVVEDEAELRKLVGEVLRAGGYTVLEAGDGQAALDLAAQQSAPIHLLLTDLVMPGMSGGELAQLLTTERPSTEVLYMSGYSEEAIRQRGGLGPGAHLLEKPFTAQVLIRKVRETLEPLQVRRQVDGKPRPHPPNGDSDS